MATGNTMPTQTFEASLIVGTLVHLVLRAHQNTPVDCTWQINDHIGTGSYAPAMVGDIEEAKDTAVAVATTHARHVLRRAGSTAAIPAITWHPV